MINRIIALVISIVFLFWLVQSMFFIVDQRQYAVVSSFGRIQRVILLPGLHFKLPVPAEEVVKLDHRIQTLSNPEDDRYTISFSSADTQPKDKDIQAVFISFALKWQIAKPHEYFAHFNNDTARAQNQLLQLTRRALIEQLSQRTQKFVLSTNQEAMIQTVLKQVSKAANPIGIKVIDIRIKRISLSAEANDAIYRRMQAEGKQIASQFRLAAVVEAGKIRAQANSQREAILSQAYQKARTIKGQGDAKAAAIEVEAAHLNPDFYRFYKKLDIYQHSFSKRDVIILDPTSEFFRWLRTPKPFSNEMSQGAAANEH